MKTSLMLLMAAAAVTTIAAGVAAVWLTGDARAFGVVVTLAGTLVGLEAARQESRRNERHRDISQTRSTAASDLNKAA